MSNSVFCPKKSRLKLVSSDAPPPLFHVISQFLLIKDFFSPPFTLLRCCLKISHLENGAVLDGTRFSLTWLLLNLSRARGSGSLIMTSAHIFLLLLSYFELRRGSVWHLGGRKKKEALSFNHKDPEWMKRKEKKTIKERKRVIKSWRQSGQRPSQFIHTVYFFFSNCH